MKKLSFFPFALALSLIDCAHGPETKTSALEALNGTHYEGTEGARPPSLPIVKRRESNSLVSGTLLVIRDGVPAPLANEKLQLLQDGSVRAETFSGSGGRFQFSAALPNGRIELRVVSDRYVGAQELFLRGYRLSDVEFVVHAK
jgi:hypothetical protein